MPPVSKQKGPSVSIPGMVQLSQVRTGIKLALYGAGKTGKTRLACDFPKPLLLIGTEDGTKSLDPKGISFFHLTNSMQMPELLKVLNDGQFRTVVMDHAGGLQDLIVKEVLGLDEMPLQRTWGMVSDIRVWGGINSQFKEHLNKLLRLTETIKYGNDYMDVIIIAHEKAFKPKEDGITLAEGYISASLTPDCERWLIGACDYVGNTYIESECETIERQVKAPGDANPHMVSVRVPTGKNTFCMRIGPNGVYRTGFRVKPDVQLPDFIPNPSYAKLRRIMYGEPTPTSQQKK